ncbi:MAG: hypothetical protein ABL986_01650 [Vicinamibacterales bacterium]
MTSPLRARRAPLAHVRNAIVALATVAVVAGASHRAEAASPDASILETAQAMFYNGRYADAATSTADGCQPESDSLTACELRTSALLFQIRRGMGKEKDKDKAYAACVQCPEIFATFIAETRRGQAIARAKLMADPNDDESLFLLGKLDLNYVWLQLGTLGKKTGWDEYWEARKSLDKVLKSNPSHVRAMVARAWIDYIVDTSMPRGTKWLLGGGNKKRGLKVVRDAAVLDADTYVRAEARFALWDMQVREKNLPGAIETAQGLAIDFPANPELRTFLDTNASTATVR